MNNFIKNWAEGIIVAVIVVTIIEMILPKGKTKKYLDVILGLYIVFTILSPIIYQFSNKNMEGIISIEQLEEKIEKSKSESYEAIESSNVNNSNNNTIKDVYIYNIENDIKSNLKVKGYKVKDVLVSVRDDENFSIERIEIFIDKNDTNSTDRKINRKIQIDDIVATSFRENTTNDETDIEESLQIKSIISERYNIDSEQILIH